MRKHLFLAAVVGMLSFVNLDIARGDWNWWGGWGSWGGWGGWGSWGDSSTTSGSQTSSSTSAATQTQRPLHGPVRLPTVHSGSYQQRLRSGQHAPEPTHSGPPAVLFRHPGRDQQRQLRNIVYAHDRGPSLPRESIELVQRALRRVFRAWKALPPDRQLWCTTISVLVRED